MGGGLGRIERNFKTAEHEDVGSRKERRRRERAQKEERERERRMRGGGDEL